MKPWPNAYTGISRRLVNIPALELLQDFPDGAVGVHRRAAGELAPAVELLRVGHAHFNPGGDPARQVAHEDRRVVARRHAVGERDAFRVLEAVGEEARQHELERLGRMPGQPQAERLVHPRSTSESSVSKL